MQKLVFTNGNGVSIDLTDNLKFGITEWSGLSETDLNIQTQTVPFNDGAVYLDALLEQREIDVTIAINDDNDLALRYQLKREMISVLNPKLGEGYLVYTNDYLSKRIKCIPQLPIFGNKNSNDSGTLKASLTFTACSPYWEDIEETEVDLEAFSNVVVENNGDVPCAIQLEVANYKTKNFAIKNDTQKISLSNISDCDKVLINTGLGEKSVISEDDVWKLSNIGELFKSVTYSENLGLFVVVGTSGTILTSSDCVTWTSQTSGVGNNLMDVTYSESLGLFVVAGASGKIITSSDGVTWTSRTSGVSVYFYSVTYSESLGLFVAVGASGTIITSSDGVTWASRTSGVSTDLSGVTYSESLGLFVVVGDSGTILTSSDGTTWTSQTSGVSVILRSVTYSESLGLFVVVGTSGTIITSSDGVTWASQTSGVSNNLRGITYSESLGLFVAVGASGTIIYTETLPDNNIIDRISSDSDMTFSLALGDNNILIYNTPRKIKAKLKYRQKYIGV